MKYPKYLQDCLHITIDNKKVKAKVLKCRPNAYHCGGDDYPIIVDTVTNETLGRAWTPNDAWVDALAYLAKKKEL